MDNIPAGELKAFPLAQRWPVCSLSSMAILLKKMDNPLKIGEAVITDGFYLSFWAVTGRMKGLPRPAPPAAIPQPQHG